MAKRQLLLAVAAVLAAAAAAAASTAAAQATAPTAYEMLEQYGFPRGILPEGVQGYALGSDGSFAVSLAGDCRVSVGGYTLRYRSHINGTVQSMSIGNLAGVTAVVAFVDVAIQGVDRAGDELTFRAGKISKSFSVDSFAVSPRCK